MTLPAQQPKGDALRELAESLDHEYSFPSHLGRASEHSNSCVRCRLESALAAHDAQPREQLAAWMIEHSIATGHGDTFADLLNEMSKHVAHLRAERDRAVAQAQIAEWTQAPFHAWPNLGDDPDHPYSQEWVAEILKYRKERITQLETALRAALTKPSEGSK